jgi:hypothetical protein
MPIKEVITTQRVPVKIWTDDVDERSKEQLSNIASLPAPTWPDDSRHFRDKNA